MLSELEVELKLVRIRVAIYILKIEKHVSIAVDRVDGLRGRECLDDTLGTHFAATHEPRQNQNAIKDPRPSHGISNL